MKKLLQFLVESIVTHPEKVSVSEQSQPGLVILTVKADPEDLKLIIGKGGRTIKALRELTRLKPIAAKKRVEIEVQEV